MKKRIFIVLNLMLYGDLTLVPAQTVKQITNEITVGKTTDAEKIEAIYNWLTQNVRYDDEHRKQQEGDTILRQEPYNVVVQKRAICMGYAKTLREMCRLAGIEAYVIEGWAKNANGKIDRAGHAWNVVKINEKWNLMDATWDSGNGVFEKKYFSAPPSVFIANHLPRDPMWQLLNAPIAFDCFTNKNACITDSLNARTTFNFTDSIRLWQTLDSAQKVYNQSVRIQLYNPNDLLSLRDLADFYVQKAKNNYAEYALIRQEIKAKKRIANQKTAVLFGVNTAINCLQLAEINYQKLIKNATPNQITDAHLNLNSVQEILKNLTDEKVFIERFFVD